MAGAPPPLQDADVYVPAQFAPDEDDVQLLLARHRAADLITAGPDGLEATMLPFFHDRDQGTLLGHFARNNDHWKRADGQQGLVIVRGPVTVHDDVDWVESLVRRLTNAHEAGSAAPWGVDDAPEKFFRGQLRAIVGVEVRIERIDVKFKLSQNRPAADIDGVVTG